MALLGISKVYKLKYLSASAKIHVCVFKWCKEKEKIVQPAKHLSCWVIASSILQKVTGIWKKKKKRKNRNTNMRMHSNAWLGLVLKSNNEDLVPEPMCCSCFISIMKSIKRYRPELMPQPRRFSSLETCQISGQKPRCSMSPHFI